MCECTNCECANYKEEFKKKLREIQSKFNLCTFRAKECELEKCLDCNNYNPKSTIYKDVKQNKIITWEDFD